MSFGKLVRASYRFVFHQSDYRELIGYGDLEETMVLLQKCN